MLFIEPMANFPIESDILNSREKYPIQSFIACSTSDHTICGRYYDKMNPKKRPQGLRQTSSSWLDCKDPTTTELISGHSCMIRHASSSPRSSLTSAWLMTTIRRLGPAFWKAPFLWLIRLGMRLVLTLSSSSAPVILQNCSGLKTVSLMGLPKAEMPMTEITVVVAEGITGSEAPGAFRGRHLAPSASTITDIFVASYLPC